MRLLFLTNFYPPLSRGGYELWCQEVADGLRARGHGVRVLTSRGECATDPDWVCRDLHLEMELASLRNGLTFFTSRKRREAENVAVMRRHLEDWMPDMVLVWGMWNLLRSLPATAEEMVPGRVAYYLGDYWPTLPSQFVNYWQAPARNWATAVPKLLLGLPARWMIAREKRPDLQFEHVFCCSRFLREELVRCGVPVQHAQVVYGAIDTSLYTSGPEEAAPADDDALNLLWAGRLRQDKGVHTAITAVSLLVHEHNLPQVTLRIAGTGESAYRAYLQELVREKDVAAQVSFIGTFPKEKMPELYRAADVFLFTSIWQEPFGRVLVEAMAAGTAVVGAPTGGAGEILIEGETGLTFPAADAAMLAQQVARLQQNPGLRAQLVENGRAAALTRFDTIRMVSELEEYLQAKIS